jgi:acyl-CoA dehydrogenase
VDVLAHALTSPLARGGGLQPDLTACPFEGQAARALWGGLNADRLGYSFAAGYGAALARLLELAGVRTSGTRFALAATESGGAHPRAIATRLDDAGVLCGEKTFATLATVADEVLVVASRGEHPDGKNRLVVVRVPRTARGVVITPRPETPFAPEIPHAFVRLDDVVVKPEDVLPGDGYDAWLKPFRTIEDVHVRASTVGYLLGVARTYEWTDRVDDLAALALLLLELGARDPSSPVTHLAVHGAFTIARSVAATLPWDRADATERARWERDAPLLSIAEGARAKRTEAARRALVTPST